MALPTGRARSLLLAGLAAIAITALVLLPGGPGLPGHPTVDVWTHAWGLYWGASELAAGRFPNHTEWLAFPRGGSVTPADPLGVALLAPISLSLGAAAGYQLQLALQLLLSALAGWAYASHFGGRWGGLLGAVACATSPTFTAEIHNGILEANWVGLVALSGAAAVRGHRLTPLAVALAALASPYHGVSAGLIAAAHLFHARDWRLLGLTALGGAAGIGLAAFALHAGLNQAEALEIKPRGIQEPTLRMNAVDPRAFFWPGDHWTVRLTRPTDCDFRRTPYLGFVLTACALRGLWLRPNARALGAVALFVCILALGPYLWWGREFYTLGGGQRLGLPLLPILELLNGGLDHPLRFLGAAVVGLAALAAVGSGRLAGLAAGLILAENLLVAPNVWPIARAAPAIPSVYASLPADGRAVIDLPAQVGDSMRSGSYLYWQTSHGRPVPYTLKPSAKVPSQNPLLRSWLALSAFGAPPRSPDETPFVGDPLTDLIDAGYGWVVLHPELCDGDAAVRAHRAAVEAALGAPKQVGGAWVWELRR